MKPKTLKCLSWALLFVWGSAHAQLPVEVFTGHERTTVDVMFFRFFKDKKGESSRWLFFNRNRAAIDYRIPQTNYLPQFGFTEAFSYNHPSLKGFAPVLVGQVLSSGVYAKAGIQYAGTNPNFTVFSWVVAQTGNDRSIDMFLLLRFTPKLYRNLHLFSQLECINTIKVNSRKDESFTQRVRLGIKLKAWQAGVGTDLTKTGTNTLLTNTGGFLRYEF